MIKLLADKQLFASSDARFCRDTCNDGQFKIRKQILFHSNLFFYLGASYTRAGNELLDETQYFLACVVVMSH